MRQSGITWDEEQHHKYQRASHRQQRIRWGTCNKGQNLSEEFTLWQAVAAVLPHAFQCQHSRMMV